MILSILAVQTVSQFTRF